MITLLVILMLIVLDATIIRTVGKLMIGLIGGLMLLDGFAVLIMVLIGLIF